jgi:multisubunit Na+/H+ antiporter MnhG subunit
MNKILDLRFVIGVFFTLVGLLLLGYGLIEFNYCYDCAKYRSINRWCGIIFTLFGIVMILLSFVKDAHDELLDEE